MLYVTGYLATQDLDSSFHEICKEEEDIQDCITTIKNASTLLLLVIFFSVCTSMLVYMQGQCLFGCVFITLLVM